ncbi:hypothetical protein [Streptomyces sp. NPDC059957]|uniref:hypothetical protein n=1 Tax=Streptomyces sp. NPDC059957 TaxID=3347016 RepID=UPI003649FE60
MGTDKSAASRVIPLVGAVLLAQLVVGCTPAPEALLAVERTESGGTRLLMAPCPDFRFRSVTVFHNVDEPELKKWTVSRDGMTGLLGQIDLFTPPDGFKVTESTLTSLESTGEYVANVRGVVGVEDSLTGKLSFTVDKVNKLSAGKVLTGVNGDKVMDRAKFMKSSSERCKP